MFPVYSVTHVPGLYPVLRSVGRLSVLQEYACGGLPSRALSRRRFRRLRDENLCIIRALSSVQGPEILFLRELTLISLLL